MFTTKPAGRSAISVMTTIICCTLLGCSSLPAMNQPVVGQAAPAFTATDVNGTAHSLASFAGKTVVLEWTNFGCPFVKKHYKNNNMQALQKQTTDAGVVWLTICSSGVGKQGYFTADEAKTQLTQHNFAGTAYLIDADGTVGKLYGAKATPHMAVIDGSGVLRYSGAIDSIKSADPKDVPMATNYVMAAIIAITGGQEVAVPQTQAYGCSVKYATK